MKREDIANRFKGDIIIWIAIFILCVYSALAVYSGIAGRAEKAESPAEYSYLLRHVFIMLVGLVLMWGVHLVKWHNALQKSGLALLIVSWVLLLVTIIFGKEVAGAKRWIDLGIFLIQTSDIAKVALIVYLSTTFANIKNYENDFKQMLKWVYAPVFITCALIGKDDNSTAMILFVIVVLMMFFARISIKKILTLMGIFVVGILFALAILSFTGGKNDSRIHTGKGRITRFFKERDPYSPEFRATLAVAEGGIFGKGPGKSDKRYKLPNIESDYIFSLIVEEYGFLFGAIPIVGIFLILTFRGIKIALNSSRKFSAYLALGITFLYVLQAFINIGVSIDCLPVTGQPMPFVSKGGSMFIMCCIAFGFVLSESRVNDEEKIAKELSEIKEEIKEETEEK
jgi:cell division protein FtsW